MLSRKISTYGKRGKRTVSPADDTVISPVRVPPPAPVDLLPIDALSPAIRRIWQARHKPSPVKRKPPPAPAPAPASAPALVKPKHRSPVTRTPLADKSNHEWSASPSLSPAPVAKKYPSPSRAKKLSPVYRKAILRTYKSRGAASKRTAARPASSSSESESKSEDEDDAGPSSRARTVKTRPSVDESDSDITPPARSTKNAAPRRTTTSQAPAPPPPPSPSVISISSDSGDDDYEPSPMPTRRRTTTTKQLEPTRKRPSSPALAKRDTKGKARARASEAQEETFKFFDSDSDDAPVVASSSKAAARARTVRGRAVLDDSGSEGFPPSQTAKTLPRRVTTSKSTASVPPPLQASSGADSKGSLRKDGDGDVTIVAPRRRPSATRAAPTNRVTSLRTASQARVASNTGAKAAAPPAADEVIELSDSDSDSDVSFVAASKTPVKVPVRLRPKTGLVPVVMLTPLRRPTLGGPVARASPARVSFVARTATPVRAVLRRKGTPLRANAKSRAPSTVSSSPSSTSLESLMAPSPEVVRDAIPEHLLPLLHECGQDAPYAFDSFLEVFRFDALHKTVGLAYRKLGEASFSEVYALGDVVLKIVPLRDEGRRPGDAEDGDEEWSVPDESDVRDVLREICITREMGALCPGFVQLLKAYVVRGTYPEHLLKLWDEYDDARKSESIRPDGFPTSQAYGVLVLPNLGTDLETFTFKPSNGWSQASAIFWQVARALRTAEQEAQFEHRDLHWGQVLVRRDGAVGVRATIIDLGLSRMQVGAGNSPLWAPIDEEVFEGKGDYQFDVYRMMRAHSGGEWSAFRPLTNVMWMHYLAVKLTQGKRLRAPASAAERRCAEGMFEAEQALASSIATATGRRKAARKTFPVFASVADVVGWAEERGWM